MKSPWDHFWLMRVTLVQFGITLQSLWSHSGYTKVRFQETFIFPTDFNGFIKCRGVACRIEKQISLPIGSFRMRFRSIWDPCWVHFVSVLRLSGRIECKFASGRPQVGSKSARKQIKHILPRDFRMTLITLTSLWHHFGALWGHFGITLRSLW